MDRSNHNRKADPEASPPIPAGLTIGVAGPALTAQLDLAERAERSGFTTISTMEAAFDAFAVTAAVATVTAQARLLTGVASWVRPPLATARVALTIDRLSGGRFELGLGTMPTQWNIDHFGIDPSRPVARLREYVAVVRGALRATASFDHHGDFFEVRGYTPLESIGDRRLPVHLAATRPGMARLAGEIADGVLYNFVHTVEWISSALDPAVTAAERARGAKIERGAMLLCVIDEDETAALERARRGFARHVDIPYFHQIAAASGFDLSEVEALLAQGRRPEAEAAIPDDLVRSMAAVGDAKACRRRVQALVGLVDWVQLLPPRHVSVAETRAGYEAIIEEFGT